MIEEICNFSDHDSLDHHLLTREAFWSGQLCTLQAYGLKNQSSTLGIELDIFNTLFLSPTSVLLFWMLIRFLAFKINRCIYRSKA